MTIARSRAANLCQVASRKSHGIHKHRRYLSRFSSCRVRQDLMEVVAGFGSKFLSQLTPSVIIQFLEMPFVLCVDDPRAVCLPNHDVGHKARKAPSTRMLPTDRGGPEPVLHAGRQVGLGSSQEKVDVIWHPAIGDHVPRRALHFVSQTVCEPSIVTVVMKDGPATIMADCVWNTSWRIPRRRRQLLLDIESLHPLESLSRSTTVSRKA